MSYRIRFDLRRLCELAAARRLYDSGVSLGLIAEQAHRSVPTIRRWLRVTGLRGPLARTRALRRGHSR
jgi:hypothetical protein